MDNLMDKVRDTGARISGAFGDFRDRVVDSVQRTAGQIVTTAGDAVRKTVNNVNKVAPNMLPSATAALAELSFRGTQGSFVDYSQPIRLIARFQPIAGSNASKFGYPACKSRPIGDLTGFCLTQNAIFEISGTVEEEQTLEELFNKGVVLDWRGME